MVASRFIKKIFTGRLESKFSLFGFYMTEAEYLKCQILRIMTECEVMVKGFFEYDEELKRIKQVEGIETIKNICLINKILKIFLQKTSCFQ